MFSNVQSATTILFQVYLLFFFLKFATIVVDYSADEESDPLHVYYFYYRLYMPHGLTVDSEDNVWVTDVALHQVRLHSKQIYTRVPELATKTQFCDCRS